MPPEPDPTEEPADATPGPEAPEPEAPEAEGSGPGMVERFLVYVPGAVGVALVAAAVVLFTGLVTLPLGLAEMLLHALIHTGLVLVAAGLAYVAWRRPVLQASLAEDAKRDKEIREIAMEALKAAIVVFTGLALAVTGGAVFQGLLGGDLPEAAVGAFRAWYLFVLVAFTGVLYAAAVLRTTQPGARDTGHLGVIVLAATGGIAAVGTVVQLGFVPGVEPRHAVFVSNVGFTLLGVFTAWFARFPDPFVGFVRQLRELPEMRRSTRNRAVLIGLVAGGLALFGLAASLILASSTGVVSLDSGMAATGAAVGTIVISVLTFLFGFRLAGRYDEEDETRRPIDEETIGEERRMSPEEIRFWSTIVASAVTATVLTILGALALVGIGPLPSGLSNDLFVFAIMAAMGPYGFYAFLERRRIEDIEDKFPELLRDLTEAQRAGMTLPEAVRSTAKSNYGVLTEELEKMAAEMSWGVSFNQSLRKFADRIDTPLINRSVALILEASKAGGNVEEILEAAARDAREIRIIHKERKMGMQTYVMIVYIAFFVFLTVVAIMGATFIPAMADAGGGVAGKDIGGAQIAQIDPSTFNTLFFHAAVVQALGGGLVAGIMGDGYPEGGLKHGFVLLIVAYVAFRFVIGL